MIVIQANNKTYNLFDSVTLGTSLDNLIDQFSFETTLQNIVPIKLNDIVSLIVDGIPKLKGFVEKVNPKVSGGERKLSYSGRSILCDLVDSSVPDEVSVNSKAITLEQLCEKTIKALGIKSKVVNKAGQIDSFTSKEIQAIGFGGKAGSFLQSFARKRGLFLNSDGSGNLVIYTPDQNLKNNLKLTDLSLTDRESILDNSKRFNTVRVGSQDNSSSATSFSSASVSRTQSAIDTDIRKSRYLEISAEQTMTNKELLKRANEEINIRRARGFSYPCTVPNHSYTKGDLVKIEDNLLGVVGTFLCRSVDYSQSLAGNMSNLVFCYPESYSSQGKRVSVRKSKMGIGKIETKVQDADDFLVLKTEFLGDIVLDGQ